MKYLRHLVFGQGTSPRRQKIKAITDLAPTANITEARYMIGLIGYYRKFFTVFNDMVRPLNELTKKNISFKLMERCKNSLDYIKQVIFTIPILVYSEPDKQYYLFIDSSKHSWSGILVQYTEKIKENDIKLKVPHPIMYQSGTFQGSQKTWSTSTKEAYAIHLFPQNGILLKGSTHNGQMQSHLPTKIHIFSH